MDPNFSKRNVFVYHDNTNEGPLIAKVAKYIQKNCSINLSLVKSADINYAHTLLIVVCPVVTRTDQDVNALLDSSRDGGDVLLVIVKRAAENSNMTLAHLSDPLSTTTRNRVGSACTLYFSGSQKFKGLKHENNLATTEIKRVINLALERKEWATFLPVVQQAVVGTRVEAGQLTFVPGLTTQGDKQFTQQSASQQIQNIQQTPVNSPIQQPVQTAVQQTVQSPLPQTVQSPVQQTTQSPFHQQSQLQQNQLAPLESQSIQTSVPIHNQPPQLLLQPPKTVPRINVVPPSQPQQNVIDPFLPVPAQSNPSVQTTQVQPTVRDPFDPQPTKSSNAFADQFNSTASNPFSDTFDEAFGPVKVTTGDPFGDAFLPQEVKQATFQRPPKEITSPVFYFFEDKSPLEVGTVKFLETHGGFTLKKCTQQMVGTSSPLLVFSPCYTIPDADTKAVLNRCRDGDDVYVVIIEPVHSHTKKSAILSTAIQKRIGSYGVIFYSLNTKTFDETERNTTLVSKVKDFIIEKQSLVPDEDKGDDDVDSTPQFVTIEGLPEKGSAESEA